MHTLYVIRASENAVKIGVTNDLVGRISHMQSNNHAPLELCISVECDTEFDMYDLELLLHQRYASYQTHGEWFCLDASVVVSDILFAVEFSRLNVLVNRDALNTQSPERIHKNNRTSDGQQRVIAHLNQNPQDARYPVRKLGEIVGVNKDTASAGRKAWQLQLPPEAPNDGETVATEAIAGVD